jgi:hypothetical protein
MPDGSILTYDVKAAPHSEKYIASIPMGMDHCGQHYRGLALTSSGRLYHLSWWLL